MSERVPGRMRWILQGRGHTVTAIDVMPEAVEVMRRRGVSDARLASWADPEISVGPSFDTVLALMNGAGVAVRFAGSTSCCGGRSTC